MIRDRKDAVKLNQGFVLPKYANVIVDIASGKLDRPFTYRIPDYLQGSLHLGSLVQIPFGAGGKLRSGYIVSFADKAAYPDEKIKEILDIRTKGTDETGDKSVRLAAWMKEQYGSTMTTALKAVITSRGQVKPIETKEVHLLLDEQQAAAQLAYYEKKHQVARHRLLEELIRVPEQPYDLITGKLHISAQTIRAMKDAGVIEVLTTSSLRNPVTIRVAGRDEKTLSDAQQRAADGVLRDFDAIQAAARSLQGKNDTPGAAADSASDSHDSMREPGTAIPRVSLIHGITGSGKTEVYIRIIEGIVERGWQAVMLIPEIALTYQTLLRFYRHFGDRVSVMNSTLSEGEKSDQWERARRGEIDVIIGPRSALFTPFPRIGVIVIDEEHEGSYKNESMPKYHARDIAVQIAKMHGGVVVLGSATPSLESYYKARSGQYRLYELTERLTGGSLPQVAIADMREELQRGNRSILSRQLQVMLEERLKKKEQAMLFINRRGFSGFVSCRSCGHVMKCPHCDVSLSLHRSGRLVCHYCGYEQNMVSVCPECGSKYISGFRAGTEQIEEALQKMYPQARILRMDADTTRKKGSYEKLLSSFANEETDILLGTQMIVKGHDFPKVTLVGILLADMSLHANDYRAAERTFQLLTQAAGRAGRAVLPGNVVIQTYEPEHYAIRHAAAQDYRGFYEEEILYRKLLQYPPAFELMAVQITSKSEDHAEAAAGAVREMLDAGSRGPFSQETAAAAMTVIGPAKASIGKLRDDYRYVVYVKSEKYDILIGCKDRIETFFAQQRDSGRDQDVNVQFDFNPMESW